jgi:hypothetical protein
VPVASQQLRVRRAEPKGGGARRPRRLQFAARTTIKAELEIAARNEIARRTEPLFRARGALREGHFLLKRGRHSDAYLEKFAILSDPAASERSVESRNA